MAKWTLPGTTNLEHGKVALQSSLTDLAASESLLRRIFANNPALALGIGEFNQPELDLLRRLRDEDSYS